MTQTATERTRTVITPDGAAVLLAAYLNVLPIPFVQVLYLAAGMHIARVEVTSRDEGPMDHPWAEALSVPDDTPGRWRSGYLVTEAGLAVADITFIWLPDPERLPAEALAGLDKGQIPAGHILGPLGVTRERRAATQPRPGDGVHSTATLMYRGLPVALAYEVTTRTALEKMAANWERCLPGTP